MTVPLRIEVTSPEQFIPMVRDVIERDWIAGQPGEQRPGILLRQQMQASFLQIPQPRREAIAEERHEAEYMVGGPAGIGVMFFDR